MILPGHDSGNRSVMAGRARWPQRAGLRLTVCGGALRTGAPYLPLSPRHYNGLKMGSVQPASLSQPIEQVMPQFRLASPGWGRLVPSAYSVLPGHGDEPPTPPALTEAFLEQKSSG